MKKVTLKDNEMALVFTPEHTRVVSPADKNASHVGILIGYGMASYISKMMSDEKALIDFLHLGLPEIAEDFEKWLKGKEEKNEE